MGKKLRPKKPSPKGAVPLLKQTNKSEPMPVSIELSAGGEHFVLGFGSHAVRIPVPLGGDSAATEARKNLTVVRDKLRDGVELPTSESLTKIIEKIKVAERALLGLELIASVLTARAKEPTALINSRAMPTQALVDTFLKTHKVEDEAVRAERKFQEKYGVDLSDLLLGEEFLA